MCEQNNICAGLNTAVKACFFSSFFNRTSRHDHQTVHPVHCPKMQAAKENECKYLRTSFLAEKAK
jgi:hypothetical protein